MGLTIKFSDGTQVHSTEFAPSKRTVKNKSGRQARKSHNGRSAVAAVGGYKNPVRAIYAEPGTPLCIVRTGTASDARLKPQEQKLLGLRPSKQGYTWELGGSTPMGYIGGRGVN